MSIKNLAFLMLTAALITTLTVSAQDEEDILVLTEEQAGQTFTIESGTVIEVSLAMPDLYLSYDPMKLQFLSFAPPEGISYPAESGVVYPENPDTNVESGSSGSSGESGVGQVIVATAEVVYPVESTGDFTEYRSTWRFKAIGAGETTLDLRTFLPPCDGKTQPCMMMPEFLISFNLEIEGDAITPELPTAVGTFVEIAPQVEINLEPFPVQVGEILILDVPDLEEPYHVIYHPVALTLLAGDSPRFAVNPWGMTTTVGVQMSDGTLLLKYLLIPAEMELPGVESDSGGD